MKLHRVLEDARFHVIRKRFLDLNARRRDALLAPGGQTRSRYRGLLETSLQLAGMAIVLDLGDETVRQDLAHAVEAAQGWLTAPDSAQRSAPQSSLVEAVFDKSGLVSIEATRLQPPHPSPGAKDDWHLGIFTMVLDTLSAFAPPDAGRGAAAAPEAWYRSTDIVAEEAFFADVRGRKCWLLGDDPGAKAACREAVTTAREPLFRSTSNALLALLEKKTPDHFHQALGETVKAHKRIFSREPERADGVFTLEGLALCRMARTYGIDVEEQTYLPVRFLAPGSLRDK
jgi:hypothetical protein